MNCVNAEELYTSGAGGFVIGRGTVGSKIKSAIEVNLRISFAAYSISSCCSMSCGALVPLMKLEEYLLRV